MDTGQSERRPPHSVEAEQCVLGAMLIDESARNKAMAVLSTEDFYLEKHREIFNQMIVLKHVDITTVHDALAKAGMAEKCGDYEYLAFLATNIQTSAAINIHSGIVKEKSQYRQILAAAQEVAEMALKESMTVLDLKGEAFRLLDVKTDTSSGTHISSAVAKYTEALERRMTHPGAEIKTGIACVDKHVGGFPNGASVIIAARPSVGKTTFVVQVAKYNAYHGKRVLFFSIEMTEEQIVDKLTASVANVDSTLLKSPAQMGEDEHLAVREAIRELGELDVVLYEDVCDIEAIKAICKQEKAERGVNLVVIDYLQIIESRRRFTSDTEKYTYISDQLKKLAKSLKCPVATLSQLRRLEGRNPEPTLSELRGSGSIEQDADIVIFLHDPHAGDYDAPADANDMDLKLIVAKNREGTRDVAVTLRYQKPTQRIVERAYTPPAQIPPPQTQQRAPRRQNPPESKPRPVAPTENNQEEITW